MKKNASAVLAMLFLLTALAGCRDAAPSQAAPSRAAPSQAPRQTPEPAAPSTFTVNFSNASDYFFNEIYISPTASNEWGGELLGSTRILKSGGSIQVDIPAYDYDNYDILVVDEERDEYHFTRVPLQNGSGVAIYFGDAGLAADVSDSGGNSVTTVYGTLESATGGDGDSAGETAGTQLGWIKFELVNGTSHIIFTEVYIMPAGTADEADIGYNHIASIERIAPGDVAAIGVDDHTYFDILLIAEDGYQWYFQSILFEEGCTASLTNHNGPGLRLDYADGTTSEDVGEIY